MQRRRHIREGVCMKRKAMRISAFSAAAVLMTACTFCADAGETEKLSQPAAQTGQAPVMDILKQVPEQFVFSSGAGAWATELNLSDDGTFTGMYHDSNMGQEIDQYPGGVVYICEFAGAFTDFQKVDDYTYRMKLGSLTYKNAGETEWDGEEGEHYIPSEAYGISGGDEFRLYLQGHPTVSLPQKFLDCTQMYMGVWGDEELPERLSIYGIYNVSQEQGFGTEPDETDSAGDTGVSSDASLEDTAGLVLPESSSRLLTGSDIAGFSPEQIQTAINEIYARHGYLFQDPDILHYFRRFTWYAGTTADMNAVWNSMTKTEQANVNFLSTNM